MKEVGKVVNWDIFGSVSKYFISARKCVRGFRKRLRTALGLKTEEQEEELKDGE